MGNELFAKESKLFWQLNHETICIEPWGRDGVRIRSTILDEIKDLAGALLPSSEVPRRQGTAGANSKVAIKIGDDKATLINGKVKAEIKENGQLCFYNSITGKLLLEEEAPRFTRPPTRWFRPVAHSNLFNLEVRFNPIGGEQFYGLGQHQHGKLDQKGCVIDLMQRNTEVCIPFLVSNLGYGFLWNNPALGRVELSENGTRWVAQATQQMDYYIVVGDNPAEILNRYADVTGHAPVMPEWATGFWQCKLRYRTQEELLDVAREYKQRGLPLAVIVVDYFHWTMMGDWKFDPAYWPDPAAMVRELEEMGVKLMVSIWPTVNIDSPNYPIMKKKGYLTRSERGGDAHMSHLVDSFPPGPAHLAYYDATNPEARKFVWEQVRKNYYNYGVKVWWLDACEPELIPMDHDNVRYHIGSGLEVGCMYPLLHQQGFWEGMRSEGEEEIISLCRSAWAGSQRYGAAVWSGDISSTFENLRIQLPAGLNIAMSGIPWWTTDIGGFVDGDPSTPYFRELIVRWFQYGVFCPLFRLHGVRLPFVEDGRGSGTGAANEVWSFGEPAYKIIRHLLFLREKLKPYLMEQMKTAHENGLPPMRPLFVGFNADLNCWKIEDQFMLGPDLLVSPILYEGQQSRKVYLPEGIGWIDAWSGKEFTGGQWIEANAPIDRIPVYWKQGSRAIFRFDQIQ